MWWVHTLEVHFPMQICSEIEHVTVTSGEQPVYYSNLHHHLQCIRYSMARYSYYSKGYGSFAKLEVAIDQIQKNPW